MTGFRKKTGDLPFTKLSGTGNHFLLFDNRHGRFTGGETLFFKEICRCDRVGADGVLLLERGKKVPVKMRYFNSDGREAEMCGNGARCCAYYAFLKAIVRESSFMLEASDGLHPVRIEGDHVHLGMNRPRDYRLPGIGRAADGEEGGFIDTGVPHYVLFVEDPGSADVRGIAPYYRHHREFKNGTNVNFAALSGENGLLVRTFERGVEGETLSCGTGCVASAYIGTLRYGFHSPVRVFTRGGTLEVYFNGNWSEVTLSGEVLIHYEARMSNRFLKTLLSL